MSIDLSTVETQIKAIVSSITVDGNPLKTYDHVPEDVDQLPAVELHPPDIKRAYVDRPDIAPMGSVTWEITWPLRVYYRLDQAKRTQDQMKANIGDLIRAFDANPGLNNSVFEARLTESTSGTIVQDSTAPVWLYECKLEAQLLV